MILRLFSGESRVLGDDRNPFLKWLDRNEGLGWATFAIGLASLVTVPGLGVTSLAGAMALVFGGGAAGGVLAGRFALSRRRAFVEAHSMTLTYELAGGRGSATKCEQRLVIQSLSDGINSFIISKRRASGSVSGSSIHFRSLGRNGRKTPPGQFIALPQSSIHSIAELSGETVDYLRLPTPLARKEAIEVCIEELASNCFPGQIEYVEKEIIFPVRDFAYSLTFDTPEKPTDVTVTVIQAGTTTQVHPLQPVADGLKVRLDWRVADAGPGESYRISWRWA